MKNFFLLISLILGLSGHIFGQTFDINKGDTINFVDEAGIKSGKWILFFQDSEKIHKNGNYLNGKKDGLWTTYYTNGKKKLEITYVKGEKRGFARVWFENGNIAEEGTWERDKWVGKYKSYYENGKLSYAWNYNEKGNRSGYQCYYHENGKIKIEGEWDNGKEKGLIKEYYSSGGLKSERNFTDGKLEKESVKYYKEGEFFIADKDSVIIQNNDIIADTVVTEKDVETDTIKIFRGKGYYVFYNKYKKTEREGYFVDGILMNGKHYIYDDTGQLIKTEKYENGKIIEVIEIQ